jgi:predicted HTH transcriptional regulator
MDKEYIVELTKRTYLLTILFPKKEPLRYKIRDLATEILAKPDEQDLETLNNFFEVAVAQNWVNATDILAVKAEYAKLGGEIVSSKPVKKKAEEDPHPLFAKNLADRQEKILGILKEKGRAQVWEMKQLFPRVSKRTLRRDFEFLLKQGVIERLGEKNNTFYKVKIA